ncbi:MAG: hypothetical protein HWD85_06950 [Flavobacteriaceae bacterium]|nr:hypothetical protein [Flavobacteriaceae bacterium]
MKKLILIQFLFLINFTSIFCQVESTQKTTINRNTFYFEVGGLSVKPFSINYDRFLFSNGNVYFNSTIGFGFPNKDSKVREYSIPFSFNLTTGFNKKNHFELGIGITYSNSDYKNNKEDIIYGGLKLGYKYQSNKHLFFKAGINIFNRIYIIEDESENDLFQDLHLIGNVFNLSLGYSF